MERNIILMEIEHFLLGTHENTFNPMLEFYFSHIAPHFRGSLLLQFFDGIFFCVRVSAHFLGCDA